MSLVITAPPPEAPPAPPSPTPTPRRRVVWLLALGCVAQVMVRLWFAQARTGPAANPDETGYLLAARWLAGGPGGDLSHNTFYQGGYSLLLAPASWLSDDPNTVYTLVMVINAVVGAAAFPLGVMLLRRLGVSGRARLPLAWAAALLPAATFFGGYALADAIMPVVVLGWLLALDRFVRDGGAYAAAGSSLIACYTDAVHSRGQVLLCVHVLALVVSRRRTALVGLGTVVAGFLAVSAFNGAIRSALYPDGARDLAAILEHRLTTFDGQLWALSGAVGQIWYLIVSTWGLAGVGLVATAAAVRRTRMAAVLLISTAGMAYASSAALPDEHRVGNFAYGRYLSCVALVYALIGLAALMRSANRQRALLAASGVAVLAVSGLWVTTFAGHRLSDYTYIGFDFPETSFLTGERTALHLTQASAVAAGLLVAFAALRWLGGRAVAAGLLAVSVGASVFLNGSHPKRVSPVSPVPGSGGVAADRSLNWMDYTKLLYPVSWTRVRRISPASGRPAPGICTVVVNRPAGTSPEASWPGHPPRWRPVPAAWPAAPWTAWRDSACP